MTSFLVEDRACDSVPRWHRQFLADVMPVIETVAKIRFRGLPVTEQEEATAEAIAGAMIAFVRLNQRGKDPTAFAGRLAVLAVARVSGGRLTSCSDSSTDAMSRLARRRRGFQLESLETGTNQTKAGWELVLAECRRVTPADLAASRVDFHEWLGRLPRRRRQIAQMLGAGHRTAEVAQAFRLSPGRVSQLRREFEDSWNSFQQDRPRAAA